MIKPKAGLDKPQAIRAAKTAAAPTHRNARRLTKGNASAPTSRLGQCWRMSPQRHYDRSMDADTALIRAWNLGMDDAGWTDEVMEKAEQLLPTLIAAGYVAVDDEAGTWWFTKNGVARAEEIVLEGPH